MLSCSVRLHERLTRRCTSVEACISSLRHCAHKRANHMDGDSYGYAYDRDSRPSRPSQPWHMRAAVPSTSGQVEQPVEDEVWEVWWCLDGWHGISERLEAMLPRWAVLKRMDPTQPLHEQVANARVLIPTTGVVDAAVINAAPHLRLITQPAAGYNNIDVAAAAARGVPVCLAPGYNSTSTAEVALTMMLMLARRIDDARAALQAGIIGEPAGWALSGKTLGIVGLGRVGLALARMAQGLGMRVVSVDSKSSRQELEGLLFSSDIVSLHTPLTPATHGLIGAPELALMKRGALLINCARGDVVHKGALYDALVSGHLGGAGLDVHWVEPPPLDDPLYLLPNVLALPHLGCAEQRAYADLARVLNENIVRVREGRELLHQLV